MSIGRSLEPRIGLFSQPVEVRNREPHEVMHAERVFSITPAGMILEPLVQYEATLRRCSDESYHGVPISHGTISMKIIRFTDLEAAERAEDHRVFMRIPGLATELFAA